MTERFEIKRPGEKTMTWPGPIRVTHGILQLLTDIEGQSTPQIAKAYAPHAWSSVERVEG